METPHLLGLKTSNTNPMSSHISEWILKHASKEKELKIGGANQLLNIGNDDRFKSSAIWGAIFDNWELKS